MFVKQTLYGVCVVTSFAYIFVISWYYYAIQWVSVNETPTPVYNAVLLEVRVQLGTAHDVTGSNRSPVPSYTCRIT
jgi:hypothetical protein